MAPRRRRALLAATTCCAACAMQQQQSPLLRHGRLGGSSSNAPARHVSQVTAGEDTPQVEVVLSDWLIDDDFQKQSAMPSTAVAQNSPYWSSRSYLGRLSLREGGVDARVSMGAYDLSSAPFRFQRLISAMWRELRKGGALEYLGSEGKARVKRAMIVLAAMAALQEHPRRDGVLSPKKIFAEMDFDSNGEVTFEEFVRWYEGSARRGAAAAALSPARLRSRCCCCGARRGPPCGSAKRGGSGAARAAAGCGG
eukprot:TRINITY_DN2913_c0_g1_i2.p3 TRINITY_DN2913_c0_g1~~TRINITY_DN2913_c0_g1_i2.p3  ORF type:complete len:253 (-),score=71.50 TRINITY_DN2913_c0_g1_i2:904-1662(-)